MTAVSGSLRMSKAEADRINGEDYKRALTVIQAETPRSTALQNAADIMSRLARVEYEDSAEQAKNARAKISAAKKREAEEAAAAEERKNRASYDAAVKAREEGDFEKAIEGFTALAKKEYSDSKAQVKATQEAKRASEYDKALQALESGKFDDAITGFTALGDYKDSRTQLTRAREGRTAERFEKYEDSYLAAVSLYEQFDFDGAIQAFKPLSEADYRDSKNRLAACQKAKEQLNAWETAYQTGIDAEKKKEWSAALDAFISCLGFRNASAHAAACALNMGGIYATPPDNGGCYLIYNKKSWYANTKTGEFRQLTDGELDTEKTNTYWSRGIAVITKDKKYGLMDVSGRELIPVKHTVLKDMDTHLIIGETESGAHLIDFAGKDLVNSDNYRYMLNGSNPIMLNCGKLFTLVGGSKLLLTADGTVIPVAKNESPLLSNDGKVYFVRTSGSGEILIGPDGGNLLTAEAIASIRNGKADERFQVYNGVVSFSRNGKWGLYDTVKNKEIVKPVYDIIQCFTADGVARMTKNKQTGVLSAAGKVLANPTYGVMDAFEGGMARVSKYTKKKIDSKQKQIRVHGFINEQGKLAVQMKYLLVGSFSSDRAYTWALIDNGQMPGNKRDTRVAYQLIDTKGKVLYQTTENIPYYSYNSRHLELPIRGILGLPVNGTNTWHIVVLDPSGKSATLTPLSTFDRDDMGYTVIDEQYILSRWTTSANRNSGSVSYNLLDKGGRSVKTWGRATGQVITFAIHTDAGFLFHESRTESVKNGKKTTNNTISYYQLYTPQMAPFSVSVPAAVSKNAKTDLLAAVKQAEAQ